MTNKLVITLGVWLLLSCPLVSASQLDLSEPERRYLDSIEFITLCTDPDWMPYEGINSSGRFTGIMSDFHQLWSDMIGKPIQLLATESWQQSLQYMQQKRCDILSSAQDIPARRHYVSVTSPFIVYPFAVATQPDNQFIINLRQVLDQHFVMVNGYAGVEMIRHQYPGIEITTVDTAAQGLKKVEKGHAFAFIDTVPSISYQTLKHGISHIKINGVLDEQYAMSVGVRRDLPELLSIYNKAINITTDSDRQSILNNWLSINFQYDFDYTLLWQILAGISVILFLFVYRYWVINRHNQELQQVNKKLEHLSHSDQLTGMPNRYYLHDAFQVELSRFNRYQHPFSIIMLDIDRFKRINDSYGHIVGDEVIKRMSRLLLQNIRENDEVGRWGGEEFLILCPETKPEGAQALAEHLRLLIQACDFAIDDIHITASFGVAGYRSDEMIDDCIKRADEALYQAKHSGRNKTVLF
jgi:polar amino acid transport system substrate-binding protein